MSPDRVHMLERKIKFLDKIFKIILIFRRGTIFIFDSTSNADKISIALNGLSESGLYYLLIPKLTT